MAVIGPWRVRGKSVAGPPWQIRGGSSVAVPWRVRSGSVAGPWQVRSGRSVSVAGPRRVRLNQITYSTLLTVTPTSSVIDHHATPTTEYKPSNSPAFSLVSPGFCKNHPLTRIE